MMHPVQQEYLNAQAEVERLCRVVEEQAKPLDAAVDSGDMSEDAWAEARDALDDSLGLTAASQRRNVARKALVEWGMQQVRALWPTYGCLMPTGALQAIEDLYARPDAERKLVPIILKLRHWV